MESHLSPPGSQPVSLLLPEPLLLPEVKNSLLGERGDRFFFFFFFFHSNPFWLLLLFKAPPTQQEVALSSQVCVSGVGAVGLDNKDPLQGPLTLSFIGFPCLGLEREGHRAHLGMAGGGHQRIYGMNFPTSTTFQ